MCVKLFYWALLTWGALVVAENDYEQKRNTATNADFYFAELSGEKVAKSAMKETSTKERQWRTIADSKVLEESSINVSNKHDSITNDDQSGSGDYEGSDKSEGVYALDSIFRPNPSEEDKKPEESNYYDLYRECGQQSVRRKRIIGGRDSTYGSHPWQVALFKKQHISPFCGAVLITDRWIATAAHCLDGKSTDEIIARVGEFNIGSKAEKLPYKEFQFDRTVIHHQYVWLKHDYDIAVARLEKTVTTSQHILPVCLPPSNLSLLYRKATASGWGLLSGGHNALQPSILKEVDIEVIPNSVCERWFVDSGHSVKIGDIFICAGNDEGGRDTCKGDSGGPLTTSVAGRQVLIGITSWGYGPCGQRRTPGVYTNVQKLLPWIQNAISY